MRLAPRNVEARDGLPPLPTAIYMPARTPGEPPSVYSGTAVQMVEQMAAEMSDEPIPVREVVEILTVALVQARKVVLGLAASTDEELAALFVYALLDRGIAQPIRATA